MHKSHLAAIEKISPRDITSSQRDPASEKIPIHTTYHRYKEKIESLIASAANAAPESVKCTKSAK